MGIVLTMRWTARLLSVTLALLFMAFVIGEGLPPALPFSMRSLSFALLAICLTGLLLAWRIEGMGAVLALVGSVGFYLNSFYLSGFRSLPGGWAFPLLIVTPLLYVAATRLEHRRGRCNSAAGCNTVP
jgi:drug/metabolite transporter (DMT)-like permease